MTWGPNEEVTVWYNLDSHIIYQVDGYVGTLTFQSRAGGAYGTHSYVISPGSVKRDGVDFTINFDAYPSPSVNEIYDGIMATFQSSTAAISDCYSAETCLQYDDGTGQNSRRAPPPLLPAIRLLLVLWVLQLLVRRCSRLHHAEREPLSKWTTQRSTFRNTLRLAG